MSSSDKTSAARNLRLFVVAAVLPASALAGCYEPPSIPVVPVSGRVTYKGKPLAGAMVTFAPPQNPDRRPAFGPTDDEGRFELSTYVTSYDQPEGAVPGDYLVSIRKTEVMDADYFKQSGMLMPDSVNPDASKAEFDDLMMKFRDSMQKMSKGTDAFMKQGEKNRKTRMAPGPGSEMEKNSPFFKKPPKHLIPAKYAHPSDSKLKATVKPTGENEFNFDLVGEVTEPIAAD